MISSRGKRLLGAMAAWLWLLGGAGCATDCPEYETMDTYDETCKACEDPPDQDCISVVPVETSLSIRLSQPLPRLVRIYRGKSYETGALVRQRAPSSDDYKETLPMGHYSVTALYVTGTDTVLAVDGTELSYQQLWWTCTKTCYETEPGEVDLALE